MKECTTAFRLQASLPRWNYWALILGLTTTLGVSIVANFQETSVIVVHMIGAFLCFGGGTAYFWTQVIIEKLTTITILTSNSFLLIIYSNSYKLLFKYFERVKIFIKLLNRSFKLL